MASLLIGTSGWNYNHWRGVFYPEELPQNKWLSYYCSHFDTVEVNNSFYRLPEKKTFEAWRDQTPDGFQFCIKASRYLTHIKRLAEPEEPLARLMDRASGLREKLNIVLYQFPPHWRIDIERLRRFLSILPPEPRSAFEFRDDSWQCDEVWSLLRSYNVAYCIMDSPGLPLHLETTCGYSYIRMHNGGEDTEGNYTGEHLREWAGRVGDMLRQGDVYVYFNNDSKGFAIQNALKLRELLQGASTAI